MKCREVRNRLAEYRSGSLSPGVSNQIRAHLPACPECSALISELDATLGLLDRRERLESNPFLYTGVKAKIDQGVNEKASGFPLFQRVFQPAMISLLIAGALFSGIRIGGKLAEDQAESIYYSEETEYYLKDLQHESLEFLLLQEPENQEK